MYGVVVMDGLTIGQASRLSGVRPKTIRFYEACGVLPPPSRTSAGYRLYDAHDLRRLHPARPARAMGLPLPEVKTLVSGAFGGECGDYVRDLRTLFARRCAEIDRQVAAMDALRSVLRALAA